MKALVWEGPGRLEIQERDIPKPQPGQVLIQSRAVGLCGSDVHIFEGKFAQAVAPLVLGHELAGVVVEAGEGVRGLGPGHRVVVSPVVSCGECHFCRRAAPHHCLHRKIIGMAGWDGGLADFFVAPAENVVRLPDSVSWLQAACIDTLACPIHALNKVPMEPGEDVVVFGAGPAGLCFNQLCRLRGASKVIVVDVNRRRLERAARLGADHVVNAAVENAPDAIRAATDGLGVDLAIEASGALTALPACVQATRNCGKILLYGVYAGPVDGVDFQDLRRREITIYGATGAPDSYSAATELISSGLASVDWMVSHQVRLPEVTRLFEEGIVRGYEGEYLKAVVTME